MKGKRSVRRKAICLILTGVLLTGLVSCSPAAGAKRRIRRKTDLEIDLSGCRIEEEKDTHAAMGDGEYLLVIDCGENGADMREQTREWREFPLSGELQAVMVEEGAAERNGIPEIGTGAWYFYDRHPAAAGDRHSENGLLSFSRCSRNFSLVLYDAENERLYYYESDT